MGKGILTTKDLPFQSPFTVSPFWQVCDCRKKKRLKWISLLFLEGLYQVDFSCHHRFERANRREERDCFIYTQPATDVYFGLGRKRNEKTALVSCRIGNRRAKETKTLPPQRWQQHLTLSESLLMLWEGIGNLILRIECDSNSPLLLLLLLRRDGTELRLNDSSKKDYFTRTSSAACNKSSRGASLITSVNSTPSDRRHCRCPTPRLSLSLSAVYTLYIRIRW